MKIRPDVRFAIVPEWVLDAEVSDRAVRLYAVLARYANESKGYAEVGRATLARRCRCSKDSIDRARAELERIGAVTVDGDWVPGPDARRSVNRYVIRAAPELLEEETETSRTGATSRTDAQGTSRTGAAVTRASSNERTTPQTDLSEQPSGPNAGTIVAAYFDNYTGDIPPVAGAIGANVKAVLAEGVPPERVLELVQGVARRGLPISRGTLQYEASGGKNEGVLDRYAREALADLKAEEEEA